MKTDRILIVEDNQALADELIELLTEKGFRAENVRSLFQFQRFPELLQIDLFIVDIVLPDGEGHDVIREIRKSSTAGIVVLSGKSDEFNKVIALEVGADDYVEKPFSVPELTARIKSLLRRLKAHSDIQEAENKQETISYGQWITDLSARALYAPDGQRVPLTRLEYDLWVAFLNNQGKVMSRDQLVYSVRGRDWAGYDRAMDGLMSRLRTKMSKFGDCDGYFITVRGVGYILKREQELAS